MTMSLLSKLRYVILAPRSLNGLRLTSITITGPDDMTGRRKPKLHGIHVLVIEDSPLERHFLRSVLESSGALVTATAAADANRAALIADVIVCDFASAEMAGGEFLPELHQLHVRLGRTVPAIALVPTGKPSARVRAAGFRVSVMKPVHGDELRAAVLEATRQQDHRIDADVVPQVIRQRLAEGRLPHDGVIELGHCQGISQLCDGCGITRHQTMTVLICRDDWRTVWLHDECFRIWDVERLVGNE